MKDRSPGDWGLSRQDLSARWPKDPEGRPEKPAFLVNLSDAGGIADMTAAQLEAYGIPVLREYREGGAAGRVVLGFSGYGADLYVPASRLEEARALLTEADSQEP